LLLKVTPKDTSYPNPETYLSVWFPGEKAHNFVQLPQLGFGGLPAGDDEYGEDPKSELSELNKLPGTGSDLTGMEAFGSAMRAILGFSQLPACHGVEGELAEVLWRYVWKLLAMCLAF
jgi:hypothetical protein